MCAALFGLMLVCSTMIFSVDCSTATRLRSEEAGAVRGAVEADIDVAVAGHFQRRDALDQTDLGNQLLRDFLRRLAQLLRQLKRDRNGQFAEVRLLGLLNDDLRLYAVTNCNMGLKRLLNTLFE